LRSCDSHCHVTPADYEDVTPDASYHPQPAPPQELERMRAALGLKRSVVVQASVYGLDNRGVEAALRRDPQNLRGVVVSNQDVSDAQLDSWHSLGVRGMRFIMSGQLGGTVGIDDLIGLAPRLAARGWHAEILPRHDEWDDVLPVLSRLPCDLVIDHLGGMPADKDDPGMLAALDYLLSGGRTWLKLIGYRLSKDLLDPRLVTRAQRFYSLAPQRMVWGSDWPHVGMADPQDAGRLLNAFAKWFDHDAAVLANVLVLNPEALFDYSSECHSTKPERKLAASWLRPN
jgi:2-pyrone-4,6-dicarboxylate lactonase